MEATDWTRPDAYAEGGDDLHATVADAGARHMLRAFDRMLAPLHRAAARTRSPGLRGDIDAAISAMVSAASVQEALRRTLHGEGPVALAAVLGDVCRGVRAGASPGTPAGLDLHGDAALTLTGRNTAWAIAAAVVEMVDLVGARSPVRVRAEFMHGHLALTVSAVTASPGGRTAGSRRRRRNEAADPSSCFLDRLADLLGARVVHDVQRGGRGMALVIRTKLHDAPPEAAG